MRGEADSWFPLESGGLLMGYWADRDSVVITDLIGPGPRARHETHSFAPDYDFQEGSVAEIYSATDGVVTYLGDWHSHPDGGTGLSRKDRRLLASMARHHESRTPKPLMAVLGNDPDWRVSIWVRRRFGLLALTRACDVRVQPPTILQT